MGKTLQGEIPFDEYLPSRSQMMNPNFEPYVVGAKMETIKGGMH